MRFFLGTHHASQGWWDAGVPLFVSRRTLAPRRTLPRARVGKLEMVAVGVALTAVRRKAAPVAA